MGMLTTIVYWKNTFIFLFLVSIFKWRCHVHPHNRERDQVKHSPSLSREVNVQPVGTAWGWFIKIRSEQNLDWKFVAMFTETSTQNPEISQLSEGAMWWNQVLIGPANTWHYVNNINGLNTLKRGCRFMCTIYRLTLAWGPLLFSLGAQLSPSHKTYFALKLGKDTMRAARTK